MTRLWLLKDKSLSFLKKMMMKVKMKTTMAKVNVQLETPSTSTKSLPNFLISIQSFHKVKFSQKKTLQKTFTKMP